MAKSPKAEKSVVAALPSVLSFSRSLELSDGFFYQKSSRNPNVAQKPLGIATSSIRTTISNRQQAAMIADPVKLDNEVSKANIQQAEHAYLDENCDTLVAKFSMKVIPFGVPANCNDALFADRLDKVISEYAASYNFDELSKRYATNIANARWLWRNRIVSKDININVECIVDSNAPKTFVFAGKKPSLKQPVVDSSDINEVAGLIAKALRGEIFLTIYVVAEANLGYGHQAFPSQNMDTSKDAKKELYQKNGVAGLHAVKIGNAIRTVDTWYPSANEQVPISLEVYGSVSGLGKAFRSPVTKQDFFTLFDNWMVNNDVPSIEQQHYVMGVLVRGGLFGKSSK